MEPALAITLGLVATVALVAVAVVFTRRAAAKRRAALEAVAQQGGWSFDETVSPETIGSAAFPLFTQGRARKASNVMRVPGSAPSVTVFDYQYTVGAGKHQHTARQTVVHVHSPRLALPPFVLGPENVLHRIGGLFGYHDIDFDSNPEFSTKYLLRSKQAEGSVRDLFTPSVRAYFEQRPPTTVEAHDDGMLIYTAGRTQKPEDVRTFVEDAQALARHFER